MAGDLRKQSFAEIWNNSAVFEQLRDDDNLKGKCGCCEFRHVCMGCRARAYAATGDFLAEEPFCVYEPGTSNQMIRDIAEAKRARLRLKSYHGRALSTINHGSSHQHLAELAIKNAGRSARAWRLGHAAGPAGDRRGGCVADGHERRRARASSSVAAMSLFWLRTPVESWLGTSAIKAQPGRERSLTLKLIVAHQASGTVSVAALLWNGQNRGLLVIGAIAA